MLGYQLLVEIGRMSGFHALGARQEAQYTGRGPATRNSTTHSNLPGRARSPMTSSNGVEGKLRLHELLAPRAQPSAPHTGSNQLRLPRVWGQLLSICIEDIDSLSEEVEAPRRGIAP